MAFEAVQKIGLTEENTAYTHSSCPDELNHNDPDQDITQLQTRRFGEQFPLGGLAGVPFTGKTGWGAFSHHIPKNGHIFATYASHVGIASRGAVGRVHRYGRKKPTTACGASVGAYNALAPKSARLLEGTTEGPQHSHQIDYLIENLKPAMPNLNSIPDFDERMAQLSLDTYTLADDYMNDIASNSWMKTTSDSKNVFLGGVMINTDEGPDLFLPLKFEYVDA